MNLYYKTEYPYSIYNFRASEFIISSPSNIQNNYYSSNLPVTIFAPVCFSSGTNILTQSGDVPVEQLAVGDRVVTTTGEVRPIRWIGHRYLNGHGCVLPHDQQPVRIRAGAFGPGLPARDLRLSPGHPVLVGADADGAGGHLVPIMCLINGTSISREPVSSVTYWHVELDAHDILLAEGLSAESYLDWGDRPFFTEGSDHALHNPDFVVPGLAARCRPWRSRGRWSRPSGRACRACSRRRSPRIAPGTGPSNSTGSRRRLQRGPHHPAGLSALLGGNPSTGST